MRCKHRIDLHRCAAALVALIAAPHAAHAETLQIESAHLDTQSAAAKKDREGKYETRELKCPAAARLTTIEAQNSYWGTYRSITWLRITCTLADGNKTTPEAGTRRTPDFDNVLSNPAIGACNHADGGFKGQDFGDYMTGVRISDDSYTKNVRIQCGTAAVDSTARTFRIGSRTLGYDYILWTAVQNDDRIATLACADDEILTGFKVRYRDDLNEAAFTYFQPFCSKVSVP
jgi:hypothetical protein